MSRIEERNYQNDPRVRALTTHRLVFNEKHMTLSWVHEDEDGNETTTVFPAVYEVCPLCNGRGSHVNPSIDCGGISDGDEFWDDDADDADDADEDGESRYFRGDYDVKCNECEGKRVVPTIDRGRAGSTSLSEYDEFMNDEDEFEAIQRAERAAGA